MRITINGKPVEYEESSVSLLELLQRNNVLSPEAVSVQVNGEFVSSSAFAATAVTDGQEVDFLFFMGGGR